MRAMASQRQSKIERFRQNKEYEGRLKELSEAVEKESVDDEVKVRWGLHLETVSSRVEGMVLEFIFT